VFIVDWRRNKGVCFSLFRFLFFINLF